jgi:uncharacterized protein
MTFDSVTFTARIRVRLVTLADLEIREEQRQIVGVAVPYGVQIRVGRYVETFRSGAFASHGPAPLTATHPREAAELPICVRAELRDEPDGLHGVCRISRSHLGDEVLELIRDGAVTGLPVGFIPVTDCWSQDRGQVERVGATLDHVAVVRTPPYLTHGSPLYAPHKISRTRCYAWPASAGSE